MNNFFVIANADKDTDFELTRTVCDAASDGGIRRDGAGTGNHRCFLDGK